MVKITSDRKVATVLQAERPWSPTGVALHGGEVYVLEYVNPNSAEHEAWAPRVRRLGKDGRVATLAAYEGGKWSSRP